MSPASGRLITTNQGETGSNLLMVLAFHSEFKSVPMRIALRGPSFWLQLVPNAFWFPEQVNRPPGIAGVRFSSPMP